MPARPMPQRNMGFGTAVKFNIRILPCVPIPPTSPSWLARATRRPRLIDVAVGFSRSCAASGDQDCVVDGGIQCSHNETPL